MCTIWRINKCRTTPYHPQGNGACERINQTVKKGLQKLLNEKNLENWDLVLPKVLFAYNTTVHSATGLTPYSLIFGDQARVPSEILLGPPSKDVSFGSFALNHAKLLSKSFEIARENSAEAQKHSKDYYDLGAIQRIFKPGDQVKIRIKSLSGQPASKLRPLWSDSYEIVSVKDVNLELRDPKNNAVFKIHSDRVALIENKLRKEPRFLASSASGTSDV